MTKCPFNYYGNHCSEDCELWADKAECCEFRLIRAALERTADKLCESNKKWDSLLKHVIMELPKK